VKETDNMLVVLTVNTSVTNGQTLYAAGAPVRVRRREKLAVGEKLLTEKRTKS